MFRVENNSVNTVEQENEQTLTTVQEEQVNTEVTNTRTNEVDFTAQMRRFQLETFYEDNTTGQVNNGQSISDEEARRIANEIIAANGGRDNLNIEGVAEDLREYAKENPANSAAIARSVLNQIKEDDRDEVAQEFIDGFSDQELIDIANTKEGEDLLERMLVPLLSSDDVHDDERATAERVFSAFRGGYDGPVFSAPPDNTFFAGELTREQLAQIDANIDSDYGQEVAAFILNLEHSSFSGDTLIAQASFTAQVLAEHKNDPAFLQSFFGTLGPETTAEIIGYISGYGYGSQIGSEEQQQAIQDIATSLSTLVESGKFNQHDMERLVGELAGMSSGGSFYFTTEVLSKASPEVNQMFFDAAKNWAFDNPNSRQANVMMAHAAQALTNSPIEFQMQSLNEMQKAGVLDDFVKMTAKGEAEYGYPPTLAELVETGSYYPINPEDTQPLTGLKTLMFNAAFEHYNEFGTLSSSDVRAIQTDLFTAAADVLQNDSSVREFYSTNTAFKDSMAALFQENYDSIIQSLVSRDNNYDITSSGLRNLNTFFREVLFTPPLGDRAASMAEFLTTKINSVMQDVDALSDAQFTEKYGRSKHDMSALMGEQYGVLVNALKESLANIRGKSEEEVKGVVDVLNAIITAGEALGGAAGPEAAVGTALVGEALKLALGEIGEDIVNGRLDEAARELRENGVDLSNFDGFAFNDVLTQIENDEAHDSFRDAFTYVLNILR